jgi:hypothetical protein
MNQEPKPQTDSDRSDWRALLGDLESSVDSLTAALQEVRLVVRRLTEATPSVDGEQWPGGQVADTADPESLREEVRQAVAQARAQLEAGALPSDVVAFAEPPEPREAEEPQTWEGAAPPQEEVEASPYESQAFPEASETETAEPQPMESAGFEMPAAESTGERDEREEVRRLVEQARAELMPEATSWNFPGGATADEPAQDETDSEEREAVRRAVAEARAELDSGGLWGREKLAGEFIPRTPLASNPPPTPGGQSNESGIPVLLVIENEESRVELAQIYELLNRLGLGSQAALLNHTPHSATLSMGNLMPPPTDMLMDVVKGIFGGDCEISSDGTRLSVRIGAPKGQNWRMSA